MSTIRRISLIFLSLLVLLSSLSCADMGAGEDDTSFYDYFSKVYLISPDGRKTQSIDKFNERMSLEDSEKVKEVVDAKEYAYIGFRVDDDYTLLVDEFAFFFKGSDSLGERSVRMVFEFYIADEMPTKVKLDKNDDYLYLPKPSEDDTVGEGDETVMLETDTSGAPVERPGEVDESIFADEGYAKGTVHMSSGWYSTHLEFPTPQEVTGGQYIIIRIRNNCETEGGAAVDEDLEKVSFTFNYLMFHFGKVTKT